jgi:hypothetical protein
MGLDNENQNLSWSQIRDAIQTIQYGYVNIVVQDGRVVQIEKIEKIRFSPKGKRGGDLTEE